MTPAQRAGEGKVADAIKALTEGKKSILILTHHNADIDAVASALALHVGLKQLGIETDIGVAESIAKPTHKLAAGFAFNIDPDCSAYDTVILVETSVPEQLASVKNVRADIIVDHHPPGKLVDKARAVWINEDAKSASQMIYHLLRELDVSIDRQLATFIAAGMAADTAHLRLAGLPEFEILVELMRTGAQWDEVLKLIETPVDKSESIAVLLAANRMRLWKIGDLVLAFSNVKSHEAAAARSLVKLGADIAVVIAEKEQEVRISSRSRPWTEKAGIDLSVIFKEVGKLINGSGGGHAQAGSANGYDKAGIEPAVKYIRREIEKTIGKQGKRLE
jgi:nanoRNase/pAp phosphatase (c-di-AMP/oligoRNAs hydrolase)